MPSCLRRGGKRFLSAQGGQLDHHPGGDRPPRRAKRNQRRKGDRSVRRARDLKQNGQAVSRYQSANGSVHYFAELDKSRNKDGAIVGKPAAKGNFGGQAGAGLPVEAAWVDLAQVEADGAAYRDGQDRPLEFKPSH